MCHKLQSYSLWQGLHRLIGYPSIAVRCARRRGEKKGKRRCAARKLEPVLTWLHIKIFLISEREGKVKELRIRRRSGGRSGSDSSSMAPASCFCNYNERVWHSWLGAKQLRHWRPKCCVDRFRPAWFHSLWGACGRCGAEVEPVECQQWCWLPLQCLLVLYCCYLCPEIDECWWMIWISVDN